MERLKASTVQTQAKTSSQPRSCQPGNKEGAGKSQRYKGINKVSTKKPPLSSYNVTFSGDTPSKMRLFNTGKRLPNKPDINPMTMPVLNGGSTWKIKKMPTMTNSPNSNSTPYTRWRNTRGSIRAVKKPIAEKHNKPTETFEYLILP